MDKTTPSSVTTGTRADRARNKAEKKAARNQHKSEAAERKAAIRAERRRLRQLRQRRRLRVDDVTVVEESALKKAVLGSVVGNLMEWYDVGVYGYVAVILGKVFLPDVDGHIQNLFSLGVFAVTFIARPLGGVILGQLGDRLGRKEVLAYTLLMMAAATFLIGVLPTYAAAGVIAPILLIALKLVQGFSTGG
ncbi:MFS transporter, partial [Actinomyces urogenitalis]